jgi:hypothetical protein
MLTESPQEVLIELRSWDGGLSLLPCPPSVPKAHRFQGGLIYSRMINIEGRALAPAALAGRRVRVFLDQLHPSNSSRRSPPHIGDLCDRTGELPGAGLEVSLYIPGDAWAPAVQCLSTIWRYLKLTSVEGDDHRMRVVDFSFHSENWSPA